MRVLWTHNSDPRVANAGVYVKTTANGVRDQGVDVDLEYLGNLRSAMQLVSARRRIRQIASEYDLVHAQYGSACGIVTSAVKTTPKVLTIRGSDWNVHRSTRSYIHLHTMLASQLTKKSLRRYDGVVTVSSRLANQVAKHAPSANLMVLPSPVDLVRFVPRDKKEARSLLGVEADDTKWILFNSLRLNNPVKRFHLAKEAFDLAQKRRGDLRLRLATNLAHEEMPLFVSACDVIICTSDNEGWPNSVKEALACNVPFVSTDVSDLQDIADVEQSCRVCPPDPRALADSICEVLEGPRPVNLRRFVADMSLEASSVALVKFYRSLAALK